MNAIRHFKQVSLTPIDNGRLANLCGQCDENIRQVERHLGVEINSRGSDFQIIGPEHSIETAGNILHELYKETKNGSPITSAAIHLRLQQTDTLPTKKDKDDAVTNDASIQTKRMLIKARNANQRRYLNHILSHDINFGIGPAGTGKTYLAVAAAVAALETEQVQRILLVRPAVEAGERLGFLPGDLAQKIDPYLRPLYDALFEMMGFDHVTKLIEKNVIEIAPLAYMRGRTLNDAYIILDESQNTTKEQMKMFLTRIGFNSTAVITGDITQVDLPHNQLSGLRHAITVLKDVDNISFTFFQARDVVRHPLVQSIVEAYAKHETINKDST